jgi:hypothetical protein
MWRALATPASGGVQETGIVASGCGACSAPAHQRTRLQVAPSSVDRITRPWVSTASSAPSCRSIRSERTRAGLPPGTSPDFFQVLPPSRLTISAYVAFYNALLKIWLGDKPADAPLKTALLGG